MSQLFDTQYEDVSPQPSEPATQPPRAADTFERTEDKYLVPIALYEPFLDLISQRMPACYPIPDTHYTLIESRYFDSAHLDFFQHHFQSLPLRFKLRTRRYGPNGEWQVYRHLELKSKQEKISRKERFRIGDDDLHYLLGGGLLTLTPTLREDNPDLKKKRLRKRIEKVNTLLHEYSPQPVCAVRYARRAFELDGTRVTMDTTLRTEQIGPLCPETISVICEGPLWEKMQKMGRKIQDDSHFLLEVKRSGTVPDWLVELTQTYELKDTAFSKYCYAMAGFVAASLGQTQQS